MANRSKVWGRELTKVYKGNEFDSCLSFLLIVKTWLYSVRPKIRNPVGFLILLNSLSYSGSVQIQCWHPSWVIRLKVQVGKQPRPRTTFTSARLPHPPAEAAVHSIIRRCSASCQKQATGNQSNPPISGQPTPLLPLHSCQWGRQFKKCFCGTVVANCLTWKI